MFRLPSAPSDSASPHEFADFAEWIAWTEGSASERRVSRNIEVLADNDYYNGVPEDDTTEGKIKDAFAVIRHRVDACRGAYPFEISDTGQTLRLRNESKDERNEGQLIYRYLLLATRMDMKNHRRHADIDGTEILEELSAEVARNYLGERADSMVFGTAEGLAFPDKVKKLCERLNEGGGFKGSGHLAVKDGKLDVVAWKHFADRRVGKLIAFGQCKTGTSYKDSFTQLQPNSFCQRWLKTSFVCPPVRMFFLADELSREQLEDNSWDAGLIFDRCRIVDFSGDIRSDVIDRIGRWTVAAKEVMMGSTG